MREILGIFIFIAIFSPSFVHAETVLRMGQDISVSGDQIVDGDYYVSVGPTGNTTMSGEVKGDMYAFGGSVTANGSIGSDITLIGGTTQLHATVTDDARIVGGEVTIGDHVGGDLFVVAGKLVILSTATIDGDVFFFGGDAEIEGKVGGSVLGNSERIRINAEVGKNIDIETGSLTLGEKALIAGNLTYASSHEVQRAQNAGVEGEVVHKKVDTEVSPRDDLQNGLVPVFIGLFAALSLFLLFRKELQTMVQEIHMHPLRSVVLGFAILIVAPIISVLLIATVLGMVIGIAGLASIIFILAIAYALGGVLLGAFIAKLCTRKLQVSLFWIVIGTFLLHAFLYIPMVGIPIFCVIILFSIGGVSQFFYKLLS